MAAQPSTVKLQVQLKLDLTDVETDALAESIGVEADTVRAVIAGLIARRGYILDQHRTLIDTCRGHLDAAYAALADAGVTDPASIPEGIRALRDKITELGAAHEQIGDLAQWLLDHTTEPAGPVGAVDAAINAIETRDRALAALGPLADTVRASVEDAYTAACDDAHQGVLEALQNARHAHDALIAAMPVPPPSPEVPDASV